jgi:hypothetical protein
MKPIQLVALLGVLTVAADSGASPLSRVGASIDRTFFAPSRARRELRAYLSKHPDLQKLDETELRIQSVGQGTVIQRVYYGAGVGTFGLFLYILEPALASGSLHSLASAATLAAFIGVVNFPMRAWRQQHINARMMREVHGATLVEALKLAEHDPSYAIPAETLDGWHEAGLFNAKDLRRKPDDGASKRPVASTATRNED